MEAVTIVKLYEYDHMQHRRLKLGTSRRTLWVKLTKRHALFVRLHFTVPK